MNADERRRALNKITEAVINYLRASGQRVGLLVNFGRPQVEVKRVVSRF
ncbi:MAG: GxxExxY protein [Armatimonadota bacterium]